MFPSSVTRQQEPGESLDRYVNALRHIAKKFAFDTISSDDILRDRIIFGILDIKVRERILREPELNLFKTLDICRAAEISKAQIKAASDLNSANIHLVKEKEGKKPPSAPAMQLRYPCRSCGRNRMESVRLPLRGERSVTGAKRRIILQRNAA